MFEFWRHIETALVFYCTSTGGRPFLAPRLRVKVASSRAHHGGQSRTGLAASLADARGAGGKGGGGGGAAARRRGKFAANTPLASATSRRTVTAARSILVAVICRSGEERSRTRFFLLFRGRARHGQARARGGLAEGALTRAVGGVQRTRPWRSLSPKHKPFMFWQLSFCFYREQLLSINISIDPLAGRQNLPSTKRAVSSLSRR